MKGLFTRRRRTAYAEDKGSLAPSAKDHAAHEDHAAYEEDTVTGWSTGARANATTAIRWAAWTLLAGSFLLSLVTYVSAPDAGPVSGPKPAAPAATGGQGAAGFAQLFVADFISAGEGDEGKLAAYYPSAKNVRLEGESGRRTGEQLTVARLRQTDPDVWSVTVAVRITSPQPDTDRPSDPSQDKANEKDEERADTVRYFQVPVAAGPAPGKATGYVALAMPSEVAAPKRITAPKLLYGAPRQAAPGDPRTKTVTEFLTAYLTGAGELDRYLAPGTALTAISPAPYKGIAVDQFAIEGDTDTGNVAVPADGTRLRLLVTLRATGHDQVRVPLTYALTLTARDGRWEIAALDGAPAPAALAQASPAPTATP